MLLESVNSHYLIINIYYYNIYYRYFNMCPITNYYTLLYTITLLYHTDIAQVSVDHAKERFNSMRGASFDAKFIFRGKCGKTFVRHFRK